MRNGIGSKKVKHDAPIIGEGLWPQVKDDWREKRLLGSVIKLTVFIRVLPAVCLWAALDSIGSSSEHVGSVPERECREVFVPAAGRRRMRSSVGTSIALYTWL